ncbi:ABC transporter substrate-binding protein [Aquimarina megaterium]|uniref:ABC transporter substrate-binding protein n=1 Tax=Aquimarina megaterium TaxID=1443666 RepID=UPI000945D195|nr:helical backbone metal receptor [Aquimarina megaterium]
MICTDQLGRRIEFLKYPKRIISLVPSQTELLVSLGVSDHIVGITKFCVHPKTIRNQKAIVGGTKKVNYEKIKKLNPDIILCNKEENTREIVEYLEKEYPVHVSDIFSISEAIEMIKQYGDIFNKKVEATTLISKIRLEKESFDNFVSGMPQKRVAYFIWKDPWMVTGKNTFVDHLLKVNGFVNVFGGKDRYPEVSKEELSTIQDLDLIMLSSEPYPFSEKHIDELKNTTTAKIILVDGEYFSWYGSRLAEAFTYFRTLHEV